jgi:SAM-dependent methyltransferase
MHPNVKTRTREQLRDHYEIEKELADRLRSAPRAERLALYGTVYNELFRRVPLHPQLTKKAEAESFKWEIDGQVRLVAPFLRRDSTFLEIGAGDCALSIAVAGLVRKVYAVDVSAEIMRDLDLPDNVEARVSDGITIPVEDSTIDVAYSNQVVEHLHPDDTLEQLSHISQALTPRGVYVCITPHRVTGPHDISKYFDDHATGFHLKEYTFRELHDRFTEAGFSRVKAFVGGRGRYAIAPPMLDETLEKILGRFSPATRRAMGSRFLIGGVLGIRIVGFK